MSREGKYLLLTLSTVVLVLLLAEPVPVEIPEARPVAVPVTVQAVVDSRTVGVLTKIALVPVGEELQLNPEAMLRKPTMVPRAMSIRPLVDFHTLGVQCSIDW